MHGLDDPKQMPIVEGSGSLRGSNGSSRETLNIERPLDMWRLLFQSTRRNYRRRFQVPLFVFDSSHPQKWSALATTKNNCYWTAWWDSLFSCFAIGLKNWHATYLLPHNSGPVLAFSIHIYSLSNLLPIPDSTFPFKSNRTLPSKSLRSTAFTPFPIWRWETVLWSVSNVAVLSTFLSLIRLLTNLSSSDRSRSETVWRVRIHSSYRRPHDTDGERPFPHVFCPPCERTWRW